MNFKGKVNKYFNMKDQLFFKENREDKENKKNKTVQNLIVFLIILIITIVAINYIWNEDKTNNNLDSKSNKVLASNNDIRSDEIEGEKEYDISKKIEEILRNIKGVGKVKVLITYSQTSKIMPMYSEDLSEKKTEENDSRWWYKNHK